MKFIAGEFIGIKTQSGEILCPDCLTIELCMELGSYYVIEESDLRGEHHIYVCDCCGNDMCSDSNEFI